MKLVAFLLYAVLFGCLGVLAAFVLFQQQPPRLVCLLMEPPPQYLPMPVDGVKASQLRNSWGAPRPGNRTHEGIDIFARRLTPVRSTTEGVVLRKGTNKLGGLIITVLGPGGQVHYYAHLEKHGKLDRLDWVLPGDVIGYVGDSGNARGTSPHLHYGVYAPSIGALNPYPLLTAPPSHKATTEQLRAEEPKA